MGNVVREKALRLGYYEKEEMGTQTSLGHFIHGQLFSFLFFSLGNTTG